MLFLLPLPHLFLLLLFLLLLSDLGRASQNAKDSIQMMITAKKKHFGQWFTDQWKAKSILKQRQNLSSVLLQSLPLFIVKL